jgi:hypothetical protein
MGVRRAVFVKAFVRAIVIAALGSAPVGAQGAPPDLKLPITKSLSGYGLVAGNSYVFRMRLYGVSAAGAPVWEELTPSIRLKGLTLSWTLGQKNPFANGVGGPVDFSQQLYLEVAVRQGTLWRILGARAKLAMVPYALWSDVSESAVPGSITSEALADGAVTAAKIGENCAPGQVLFKNATGGWECAVIRPAANGIAVVGSTSASVWCASNWGSCDGNPLNGCETNLLTSVANCSACGAACGGGQLCCTGACASVLTDSSNCGTCGQVCAGGTTCTSGGCVCPPATPTLCAGTCRNTATDANNCGSCGVVCASGATCVSGVCVCSAGLVNCGAKGCRDLSSDPQACGTCGTVCAAGKACVAGVCQP